ncbi:hypothetical protein ACS0ZG_23690 [Burkholderia gladioli]|uniref:Uncharacterized protein n=1 Tax=Burkholderia gladioli (strain BSR3) TaxID=999541 RepID=F2LHC7_BURGS|nr:hypothetical protein [Burkholderia gladioli]AEA58854.1 hypothetical protein bgla_1g01530 [Burkholderia gladioli BSR3]MBW5282952.1 hypothetical protein [Burkholderia gladioli]MDA0572798.1 hypothetical protein [Burkholderia gladioli]MDA0601150.1 hypothetical protein [Burkholderia gladioli]CAG9211788.1 conserved hypothetical protein [Burkholderia gladioli]
MKIFARLVLTLLLTLPIYVGVTALPWLSHWFDNGNGWDIAAPIFRALGSYGGEEDEDYLYGSLLLISFFLALISSVLIVGWADRLLRRSSRKNV